MMKTILSFIVAVGSFSLCIGSAVGSSSSDTVDFDVATSNSMTAVEICCHQQLEGYKEDHPPVAYLGDPMSENWPDPSLMAEKVERAFELYRMLSHPESASCQQMVREACWEYCGAGIKPGALDLYCIFHACTDDKVTTTHTTKLRK